MVAGRNILIVEDEPLIAMMLEDCLKELGHQVHACCETLTDSLAAIDAGGFDAAILDLNLHGDEAWPAAERLREQQLPFAIASGGDVESAPEGFEAVPKLAKPFTFDSVAAMLEKLP